MIENPFFHRGPIRDPGYFYNRNYEVKRTLKMLSKGQSVSIIGPRKIGKTSLLFHISRPEVMQEHGLDPACHLIVYFTCEGSGQLALEELYALILEEVVARASQLGYAFTRPGRPVSYLEFESFLREASRQDLKLTLLLDEFEIWGASRDSGEELLSSLRALTTKFDIGFLTVSKQQLAAFTDHHSPFFNIFFPVKLGLFDKSGSRDLIEGSLLKVDASFPPEAVDGIIALGGEHPFFLQVVAYWALELQDTKGGPLESKDMRLLAQTVRSQVEPHFKYYWENLTSDERYVLAALPFTQDVEIHRNQLEKLDSLCLIVKDGDRYRYFSPLFHDFVRRQKVDRLLQAGPFVLEPTLKDALLHEQPLSLSEKQFDLLSYLVAHEGKIVSIKELDRHVMWPLPEEQHEYVFLGDERLKSVLKGLRKELGDTAECIVNKRGVGYMFQVPLEE